MPIHADLCWRFGCAKCAYGCMTSLLAPRGNSMTPHLASWMKGGDQYAVIHKHVVANKRHPQRIALLTDEVGRRRHVQHNDNSIKEGMEVKSHCMNGKWRSRSHV